MEKIGLEAVLNMTGFSRQVARYKKGIAEIEADTGQSATTMEKAVTIVDAFGGSIFKTIPMLYVGQKAVEAFGRAFEFGKQGAVVAQTQESFENLMRSMGAGPDILEDMRKAVNYTVDDMTLMSGTMTMLAGASDDLGRAMVKAAPDLLEISKAAVKLKPSLGDVSHVYDSLALGIKRNSPMLIDNANIMVKVGEANERYAAKIGKVVEDLTAEDEQMALLEETLRAGQVMIDQVGGSTDSMTDSFDQATVAIKNLTDYIKADSAPIIGNFVEVLVDGLEIITELYNPTTEWGKAIGSAINPVLGLKNAMEDLMEMMGVELDVMELLIKGPLPQLYEAYMDTADAKEKARKALEDSVEPYGKYTNAILTAGQVMEDVVVTTEDLEKAQKALESVIKDVMKAYEEFTTTLAKGIIKYRDLGDQAQASSKKYQEALEDLAREGSKSLQKVREDFEASLPNATTVAERMEMAGDAWDEWGLRIQDIIEHGVESPWYAALEQMGYSKPPDVGMRGWLEDLKQRFYAGQLPDLLPPEWAEKVRQQQEEATRVVQAENAKRRAEVEAARQAELDAERAARQDMLFELTLALAEAQGKLEAWAGQKFGPNWEAVIGDVDNLKAYIEAGIIEIDDSLMGMIRDTAAGIGVTLDETALAAEQNMQKIDDLFSQDLSEQAARSMSIEEIKQQWFGGVGEMYQYVEDEVPETPFDPILNNFDDVSNSIITQTTLMGLDMQGTFDEIDMKWAMTVLSQVETWDKGMTEVEKTIQEKVIDKLGEIPTKIVVTVTTEQEGGGTEGKQHGGPVQAGVPYVVGEAGPELFVPEQGGTVLPHNWTMALPALTAMAGGAGGTAGPPIQITMNPTINTPMDLAEFEMITERTVQRAIRGIP